VSVYTRYYGFKERPFEITPDPRFIYLSENHQEALAHLKYAVQEGKSFSVITGEAGTGKTTLVQLLLNSLDGHVHTCYIFNPILDRADFLNYVCEDLGIESVEMKSRGQCLAALHSFLLARFAEDEKVFLIIDEAQTLDTDLLQEVRLLTNLETSRSKLLHVILLGQPELKKILAQSHFRPLKQRITVRYHLNHLNRKETKEYILFRMKRAGAQNIALFEESAIREIYKYSKGIPRLINIVCDNALLAGYAGEHKRIGRALIRGVIRDLEGGGTGNGRRKTLAVLLLLLIVIAGVLYLLQTAGYVNIDKFFSE
jgi:general secretion pathway protein A